MAQLEGESRDVANNFLGSEFWQPGTSVAGTVLRKFETANGLCYGLQLSEPVRLNEQETSEVALGNLTGLRMALQAAGVDELQVGDEIQLDAPAFSRPIKAMIASTSRFTSIAPMKRLRRNAPQRDL